MTRAVETLSYLCAAALAVTALAASVPTMAADPAAGETKASSCRSCHGANGNSPFDGIPSLAAQPSSYIRSQISLYKEQRRQIPEMNAAVAHLTAADIADIAAYFAAQKPSDPPADTDRARMARGRKLAETQKCHTCHQPNFAGKDQVARLSGQREDYLLKAMHDFKSGARVGTDGIMPGKMHAASEKNMEDLAYFLAHIR